jgi:hypothetical protein
MADEHRRVIIDRANRLLRQSRALRKMSNELLQESRDIRSSMKLIAAKSGRKKRARR